MSNYWIFQANPRTFFIVHYYLKDYVTQHPDCGNRWKIKKSFKDKIRPGDIAFIWKAKGEPQEKDAPEYSMWRKSFGAEIATLSGIYAVAEVTSEAKPQVAIVSENESWRRYYVSGTWERLLTTEWRCDNKINRNLVGEPLLETKLWQDIVPYPDYLPALNALDPPRF